MIADLAGITEVQTRHIAETIEYRRRTDIRRFILRLWYQSSLKTGSPFPLLLDPTREAFGLERSLLRSWGPKNLWYYLKSRLSGRQAHTTGGDITQPGGDFIIDATGVARLIHRSLDPTDRPAIAELLATLKQLQG